MGSTFRPILTILVSGSGVICMPCVDSGQVGVPFIGFRGFSQPQPFAVMALDGVSLLTIPLARDDSCPQESPRTSGEYRPSTGSRSRGGSDRHIFGLHVSPLFSVERGSW